MTLLFKHSALAFPRMEIAQDQEILSRMFPVSSVAAFCGADCGTTAANRSSGQGWPLPVGQEWLKYPFKDAV